MSPRTKFVLIFLLFSIPFVGSTLVYVFWRPSATANYGELISPVVVLPDTGLDVIDGGAATPDELARSLRGKWLLLTLASGKCTNDCEKNLYAMRQSRLMLGREQDRVLRVVLLNDEFLPEPDLKQKYAGTVWLSPKTPGWRNMVERLAGEAAPGQPRIYGVDPLGNLFIRYQSDPDIRRMNRDIQRVLKASQIG